jgi:DNA adenine methylase
VVVKPIVKWAGGKSWLVPALRPLLPPSMRTYVEPFAGGAAVFFALASESPRPFKRAILVDQNEELVACYRAVKNDVTKLLKKLGEFVYDKDMFYEVRAQKTSKMSDVERGARLIYLNKTCFNGLWRVNSKGEFNVPFGRMLNPKIKDEPNLMAASRALANCDIRFGDFASVLKELGPQDFVYFDPPYVPVSKTANFTSYASGGFDEKDQARLVDVMVELRERGVGAVLSNADTQETRVLYERFAQTTVLARRSINSNISRRGPTAELVVQNELAPSGAAATPKKRASSTTAKKTASKKTASKKTASRKTASRKTASKKEHGTRHEVLRP